VRPTCTFVYVDTTDSISGESGVAFTRKRSKSIGTGTKRRLAGVQIRVDAIDGIRAFALCPRVNVVANRVTEVGVANAVLSTHRLKIARAIRALGMAAECSALVHIDTALAISDEPVVTRAFKRSSGISTQTVFITRVRERRIRALVTVDTPHPVAHPAIKTRTCERPITVATDSMCSTRGVDALVLVEAS
jgi:hypothetical protein